MSDEGTVLMLIIGPVPIIAGLFAVGTDAAVPLHAPSCTRCPG